MGGGINLIKGEKYESFKKCLRDYIIKNLKHEDNDQRYHG